MLQGYDIQKLEDQIFAEEIEYDALSNTSLRITERQQNKQSRRSEPNVQRDESLAKYFLSSRIASNHPTLYILHSMCCNILC
jgi:hypothetical protein